jgi:cobalt/nickel transport system permease protein
MHIEPGLIEPARITAANAAALGLVATQAPRLADPLQIVKTVLAASVFSVLMQAWHLPVGPSELHLIGATTVYLLFGFGPTIIGFALGLLLQAGLFEPQDMLHLGVNSLSLMVPLLVMHYTYGRRLFDTERHERFTLARVLRLDAIYYAGVTSMVGFWLLISKDPAPVTDWGRWALAYLPVFLVEALITFTAVTLIGRWRIRPLVERFSAVGRLTFAN